MRANILIAVSAVIACVICYFVGQFVGYQSGTKASPLREDKEAQLGYAVALYQSAEATNWVRVQGGIGIQVLGLTRDYERRFGVPAPTNPFGERFARALAISLEIETNL